MFAFSIKVAWNSPLVFTAITRMEAASRASKLDILRLMPPLGDLTWTHECLIGPAAFRCAISCRFESTIGRYRAPRSDMSTIASAIRRKYPSPTCCRGMRYPITPLWQSSDLSVDSIPTYRRNSSRSVARYHVQAGISCHIRSPPCVLHCLPFLGPDYRSRQHVPISPRCTLCLER
jgi:hypothetical protein